MIIVVQSTIKFTIPTQLLATLCVLHYITVNIWL